MAQHHRPLPNEKVMLADDGIHVQRGRRQRTSEPYDRMYQVVDYGALTDKALSSLKTKGIAVVQSGLPGGPWVKLKIAPALSFARVRREAAPV